MRMIHSPRFLPALPLLLVGALVACGGDPYAAPGEKVDQAIASRLAASDGARRLPDRVHARRAQPVERHARHGHRQT